MNFQHARFRSAMPVALIVLCGFLGSQWAHGAQPPATSNGGPPAQQSAKAEPSKGEKQAEAWFKMLDSNKDGYLSWEEVKHIAPLAKDFKAADTDRNGLVSRDEIRTLSRQRVAERRARKAREAEAKAAAQASNSPAPQASASSPSP